MHADVELTLPDLAGKIDKSKKHVNKSQFNFKKAMAHIKTAVELLHSDVVRNVLALVPGQLDISQALILQQQQRMQQQQQPGGAMQPTDNDFTLNDPNTAQSSFNAAPGAGMAGSIWDATPTAALSGINLHEPFCTLPYARRSVRIFNALRQLYLNMGFANFYMLMKKAARYYRYTNAPINYPAVAEFLFNCRNIHSLMMQQSQDFLHKFRRSDDDEDASAGFFSGMKHKAGMAISRKLNKRSVPEAVAMAALLSDESGLGTATSQIQLQSAVQFVLAIHRHYIKYRTHVAYLVRDRHGRSRHS